MAHEYYIAPTTLGTYVLVSQALDPEQSQIMQWIFDQGQSPSLNELMHTLSEQMPVDTLKDRLSEMMRNRFLIQSQKPYQPSTEAMQDALPELLKQLSPANRALLTDDGGLTIASVGFDQTVDEELPVFASKLVSALQHGDSKLFDLLEIKYGLPCLFDIPNKSLVSFIPIQMRETLFIAVVYGTPHLSTDVFRDLVWILWTRYAR